MISKKNIFIYGFSIFSMFFGSGNLVYPLKIGLDAQDQWMTSFLGLFLTGVILPFMGVLVVKLYKGDYHTFFAQGGTIVRLLLPLVALSLLGSFGVLPRCILVAYGSIERLLPSLSLLSFAILFCGTAYTVCLREQWMIGALGKVLTPILIIFLTILIAMGVALSPNIMIPRMSAQQSFQQGFIQGYETMDLLAAFFFSSVIFQNLQRKCPDASSSELFKIAIKSSIVGTILLALVYIAFVYLGASFASVIQDAAPECILPIIAECVLGRFSSILLGCIVILSCLTTFVALNNIYTRYLTEILKIHHTRFPVILLVTTVTSIVISTLNFKGISAFLSPILDVVYPGLIALTVLGLITRHPRILKKVVFYSVVIGCCCWSLLLK